MVVTRFPPSPTGDLHIGGARTALYSWLYAKKHQGKFVLRIEDTDRERSSEEAVEVILEGMAWLGLSHDEGPYFQTQRFERYAEVIQQLLDQGDAYYCTCSKERLDTMREQQRANKQKPKYDGCCRGQNHSEGVIRFKNPIEGAVVIDDLVKGKVVVSNAELDDLVIARADGTPTYNLTVVVDDMDMQMTHVIRGDDHINNTPRQMNILAALGADIPQYAHVPMILGSDGARLSKRHGAASVLQYRDEGYLPEALLNYLVRLGWSHGEQEIFSISEMVALFDLDAVNKAASTFNQEKLLWINQQHIMQAKPEELAETLQWHYDKLGIDTSFGPALADVVSVMQQRAKTMVEMAQTSGYFYQDFDGFEEKAAKKNLNAEALPVLEALKNAYTDLEDWRKEPIHQVVKDVTAALDTKMGKVGQPLRVATTGGGLSPSIDDTLVLIGKERTLARLEQAIGFVQS